MRSHHGRVTDRLPSINGFAVKLPARDARALRRSKQVLNLTLNTRVRSTGIDGGSLATTYPKTVGADKLWAAGITGKGVGVAVVDSGINGDMPDFKNADGSSRITANVIANPDATRPGDDVGHGTHVAGIIAGNSFNRAAGDPAHGALRRHRARGRPGRGQDGRRRRRLDRARRHHGAAVRRRPQGRPQHPRRQPLDHPRTRPAPTATIRSTPPSSSPGTPASSSSPPRATAATRPTPSGTPRATTRT